MVSEWVVPSCKKAMVPDHVPHKSNGFEDSSDNFYFHFAIAGYILDKNVGDQYAETRNSERTIPLSIYPGRLNISASAWLAFRPVTPPPHGLCWAYVRCSTGFSNGCSLRAAVLSGLFPSCRKTMAPNYVMDLWVILALRLFSM